MKISKRIISTLISFTLILPLFACTKPETPVSGIKKGELILNEVMSDNETTLKDSVGNASDWIEIYNPTDRDLSLSGCNLTNDPTNPTLFAFPDVTVKAKGYLVVFASAMTYQSETEIHLPFKLSGGEVLTLGNGTQAISSLRVPSDLATDMTYGIGTDEEGSHTAYLAHPTPGAVNADRFEERFSDLVNEDAGLVINEFMMKNKGVIYDEFGDCPDWVEIRNVSEHEINLYGFGLSDNFSDPLKWTFPNIILPSGEILLVLLSGKETEYTEQSPYLHADFKLSDADDGLLLSDHRGVRIDRIDTVQIPDSASYGRDPANASLWKFFASPTPGKANPANGLDSLEQTLASMPQRVYINEVCSVSSERRSDTPDEDWIELYNNTSQDVNLSGWSLGKSVSNLRRYTLPDVTIPAYGYLVLSAGDEASHSKKSLDVGFKIDFSGDTLFLVNPDSVVTDSFETGYQRRSVTAGRVLENGTLIRRFFSSPTKGRENGSESYPGYTSEVTITSQSDRLTAELHQITMQTADKNAVIHYTLDGTVPTQASAKYTSPLTVKSSTVVRAVAYSDGRLPSDVATKTLLVEEPHDLPTVCITCAPDDLFSYESGIWADGPGWTEEHPHNGANYWKNWEKEAYFEYYDVNGTLCVDFSAGMKNHGQYSRSEPQKSFSINLKESYGSSTVTYPFFGNDAITTFDNLLLRTGSQDANYTNIMDAYCARVVDGQMDIDLMKDAPVALYVNGQYWGLYFLREKINESYLYYHHGIERDNLDVIKGNKGVETGSYKAHGALLDYIATHDLSIQENFDYVASQIDLEEWTNYWIAESFLANTDSGNIRFYNTRDGKGKWRWIMFDLDYALFRTTYKKNMILEFLDPNGHGYNNYFNTSIAINLLKNEEFKSYFIDRYAYHLNTTFQTERMLAILDEMVAQVDAEMVRQCDRWGYISFSRWESNISTMRRIIDERWELSVSHLQEAFQLPDEEIARLFPTYQQ